MSIKRSIKSFFWLAAGIFGFVLGGGLFTPAQATHIACGDVLGPGGNHVLDSDVGPCPGSGITVKSSAKLDMAGFTVSCVSTTLGIGISVEGVNAVVTTGIVTGCLRGFVVFGRKHKVLDNDANGNDIGFISSAIDTMLIGNFADGNTVGFFAINGKNSNLINNDAQNNTDEGFLISEDKATLTGNRASANGLEGYKIEGNKNKLVANTANNNVIEGFFVAGDTNVLTGNFAITNGLHGFSIEGNKNKLTGNLAINNSFEGFVINGDNNNLTANAASDNVTGFLIAGTKNPLTVNSAFDNTADGFKIKINGDSNILNQNESRANGENGFDINGNSNKLSNNLAINNGDDGFDLDGADNRLTQNKASFNGVSGPPGDRNGFNINNDLNTLIGNTAKDNTEHGFVIKSGMLGNVVDGNASATNGLQDMRDLNNECSSNTWRRNSFGTSDPSCIQ